MEEGSNSCMVELLADVVTLTDPRIGFPLSLGNLLKIQDASEPKGCPQIRDQNILGKGNERRPIYAVVLYISGWADLKISVCRWPERPNRNGGGFKVISLYESEWSPCYPSLAFIIRGDEGTKTSALPSLIGHGIPRESNEL